MRQRLILQRDSIFLLSSCIFMKRDTLGHFKLFNTSQSDLRAVGSFNYFRHSIPQRHDYFFLPLLKSLQLSKGFALCLNMRQPCLTTQIIFLKLASALVYIAQSALMTSKFMLINFLHPNVRSSGISTSHSLHFSRVLRFLIILVW